jgi:dolichol kinase
LPWNPAKSWGGSLAFLAVAAPVAWALAAWTLRGHPHAGATPERLVLGAALAAVTGALAESLPLPVTDNLVVILAAGGAFAAVLLLP